MNCKLKRVKIGVFLSYKLSCSFSLVFFSQSVFHELFCAFSHAWSLFGGKRRFITHFAQCLKIAQKVALRTKLAAKQCYQTSHFNRTKNSKIEMRHFEQFSNNVHASVLWQRFHWKVSFFDECKVSNLSRFLSHIFPSVDSWSKSKLYPKYIVWVDIV